MYFSLRSYQFRKLRHLWKFIDKHFNFYDSFFTTFIIVEVFIHIKKRYTYILLNIVLLIKVKIIGIIEHQILNAAHENQWMSLVVKIITMTNHYSVESQNHSCSNTTNIVRARYASVPKFKFVLHRKYLQRKQNCCVFVVDILSLCHKLRILKES